MAILLTQESLKFSYLQKNNEILFWQLPLQTGIICDGEIIGFDLLKNILKSEINKKIKTKKVCLLIKSSKCVIRIAELPKVNLKQLDQIINKNVSDYFPLNLENYITDYKLLDISEDKLNIMLAAYPLVFVDDYIKLFKCQKLRLVCVDFYENAATDYLSSLYKGALLILTDNSGRLCLTFLNKEIIKAVRELTFLNEQDIIEETDKLIRFYFLNLNYKVYFLCDSFIFLQNYFRDQLVEIVPFNNNDDENILHCYINRNISCRRR